MTPPLLRERRPEALRTKARHEMLMGCHSRHQRRRRGRAGRRGGVLRQVEPASTRMREYPIARWAPFARRWPP